MPGGKKVLDGTQKMKSWNTENIVLVMAERATQYVKVVSEANITL